jgi:thioredoxin reductase (NADPH)
VAAHGDVSLEAIDVRDSTTGEVSRLASGGIFIFIGADAETGWLPPEIALDRHGYVLTGADLQATGRWTLDRDPYLLETSVSGIFACGDVRCGPVKRVAASVGEGSMAIAFVHQFLRDTGRTEAKPLAEPSRDADSHIAKESATVSAAAP